MVTTRDMPKYGRCHGTSIEPELEPELQLEPQPELEIARATATATATATARASRYRCLLSWSLVRVEGGSAIVVGGVRVVVAGAAQSRFDPNPDLRYGGRACCHILHCPHVQSCAGLAGVGARVRG